MKARGIPFKTYNHKIISVEVIPHRVDVYDIEVEEFHNFIANEICVHNSADSPQVHNFPVRDEYLKQLVRQCIVARKGHRLVELDYSGIEVRIAACYHKDPVMLDYIHDPSKDMHRDMAMQCYLLPQEEITPKIRYNGKNMFVFPQFYGSWWLDCARALWEAAQKDTTASGTSLLEHLHEKGIKKLGAQDKSNPRPKPHTFEAHIAKVEANFWGKRFKLYTQWKKQWYSEYRKKGWFLTKTGFICQGYMSRNDVINYPVQGSAFHCLLWSLNDLVLRRMRKAHMKTQIVGQIHDSIIADAPEREVDDFLHLARDVMVDNLKSEWGWIIVPLKVDAEVTTIGGSWVDKKKVEIT